MPPSGEKYEMFANRLIKVNRHISKWARKQGISCYRVYDDDLPEFPLAVDVYENILHVAEYERPHGMEPNEHVAWLEGCLEVLSEVLGVTKNLIYLKFRQRQKGLSQYERFSRVGAEYIVRENGLKFIINPSDYLDTGLFLDHRDTRQLVRTRSEGKRVLNLFAYTGSFSVYAAAGGAAETLTVDLSNTYLQWADRNLALNGFSGNNHHLLQADVLQWLRVAPKRSWDLIVVDPPTFSNSKRMDGTLDIQRDHVWMLTRVLDLVAPGGTVFFSTNFRKFKLEEEGLKAKSIKNISAQTIPEDFRNKRIHHCFEMSMF
jgi:23S rRNA (cytosine1962-C5)-methyltransferase